MANHLLISLIEPSNSETNYANYVVIPLLGAHKSSSLSVCGVVWAICLDSSGHSLTCEILSDRTLMLISNRIPRSKYLEVSHGDLSLLIRM